MNTLTLQEMNPVYLGYECKSLLRDWTVAESTNPIARASKAAIAELISEEALDFYHDRGWELLGAIAQFIVTANTWAIKQARKALAKAEVTEAKPVLDGAGERPGALFQVEQEPSAWMRWKAYLMKLLSIDVRMTLWDR